MVEHESMNSNDGRERRDRALEDWSVAVVYERDGEMRHLALSGPASYDLIQCVTDVAYLVAWPGKSPIPHTIIRIMVENFAHACFYGAMVVVDEGERAIRFIDDFPWSPDEARRPVSGVSAASDAAKTVIRGVGSGYRIAFDWADGSDERSINFDEERERGWCVTVRVGECASSRLDLVVRVAAAVAAEYGTTERKVIIEPGRGSDEAGRLLLFILREKYGWSCEEIARYFRLAAEETEDLCAAASWLLKTYRVRTRFEKICRRLDRPVSPPGAGLGD